MSKKIIPNNRRRTCKHAGCKHKLSIYNHEVYCYVHQQLALGKSSSAPVAYQRYFQELAVKP